MSSDFRCRKEMVKSYDFHEVTSKQQSWWSWTLRFFKCDSVMDAMADFLKPPADAGQFLLCKVQCATCCEDAGCSLQ